MATIRIQQVKSSIGAPEREKQTLLSLGLSKRGHIVEKEDCPSIRGMVQRVHHLVTILEDK